MTKNYILPASIILLCTACGSVGYYVEPEIRDQIRVGITTKAKAIELCGNPTGTSIDNNGNSVLVWSYAHYNSFSGRRDVAALELLFNPEGVLINKSQTSTLHH